MFCLVRGMWGILAAPVVLRVHRKGLDDFAAWRLRGVEYAPKALVLLWVRMPLRQWLIRQMGCFENGG